MLVRQEITTNAGRKRSGGGSNPVESKRWSATRGALARRLIYNYKQPRARNPANGDNHTIASLEFFWFADTGVSARNGGPIGVLQGSMTVDFRSASGGRVPTPAHCRNRSSCSQQNPLEAPANPTTGLRRATRGLRGSYNPSLVVSLSAADFAVNPLLQKLQPYPFEKLRALFKGVTPRAIWRRSALVSASRNMQRRR
jgi:hypothetical protein